MTAANDLQNPEEAAPGKEPRIEDTPQFLGSERSYDGQGWVLPGGVGGVGRRGAMLPDLEANGLFHFSKTFCSFRTLVLPSHPQGG